MLTVGMYVSCPIYKYNTYIYVLGKITKYEKNTGRLEVVFYDHEKKDRLLNILDDNKSSYYYHEVTRADSIDAVKAKYRNSVVNIVCRKKTNSNSFAEYCCQYKKDNNTHALIISESELEIDFYHLKNKAREEAYRFQNSNLSKFFARQTLSKRKVYNDSLEKILYLLVNSRVILYPHQIDAVLKATKKENTRVMFADEVGLGKTIEALTVLKYHMERCPQFRCIIVTPRSLVYQWKNEIRDRFEIKGEVLFLSNILYREVNAPVYIISYEDFYKYKDEIIEINWDMLIIDEAHKILDKSYYSTMLSASRKIRHVALLSATPIIHNGIEYLQLMKLLNPWIYENMDLEQFKALVGIQTFIQEKMFDMKNELSVYEQMDMTAEYVLTLQELNDELNDEYLKRVIASISEDSMDRGLYAVKLALEYIQARYVIESPVIRHRRVDIKEANIQRTLKRKILYDMEGADQGVYESNLYDTLLSVIAGKIDRANKYEWINVLEAMHSSPFALSNAISSIEINAQEKRIVTELLENWKDYCEIEIYQLLHNQSKNRTRFSILIDAIEKSEANKILIFSEFSETVAAIFVLITKKYGEKSAVLFVKGMTRLETQLAASEFKGEKSCRFIVCDSTGGEGINFQNADLIIHFDISFSPAMMEQRIGRLDRIGRDTNHPVESIAIIAEGTVEENIFNIYNDTLRLFNRSLCGLEIIFEDLHEMIVNALLEDTMFGLSHVSNKISDIVSTMENDVEREIYYATSNETDKSQLLRVKEVVEEFDKEKESDAEKRIIQWLYYSGVNHIRVNPNTSIDIDFVKSDRKELRKNLFFEAFQMEKISGTFVRENAITCNDICYFHPASKLCQVINSQINRNQTGRFVAISASKEEIIWAGFILVWNVDCNWTELLKGKLNPQKYRYIRKYLNEQQITTTQKLLGRTELNATEIISLLDEQNVHYLDSIEDTAGYGNLYDEYSSWVELVDKTLLAANSEAKRLAHSWVKTSELINSLQIERINQEISKETVCYLDRKTKNKESAILSALAECQLKIDSIMYIEI